VSVNCQKLADVILETNGKDKFIELAPDVSVFVFVIKLNDVLQEFIFRK